MDKVPTNKRGLVMSQDVSLDKEYIEWIHELKSRFRNSQIKAAVKVNSEQLLFNWQLGRDLVVRKAEEKWGTGIVNQVSLDLQANFRKRRVFLPEICEKKLNQPDSELIFPSLFAFVPWRHHVMIVQTAKSVDEALFYIRKTIEGNLSRSALDDCIRADLYHTSGAAVTNFAEKLPPVQGALAKEIIKSNYDFGFVSLPDSFDGRIYIGFLCEMEADCSAKLSPHTEEEYHYEKSNDRSNGACYFAGGEP